MIILSHAFTLGAVSKASHRLEVKIIIRHGNTVVGRMDISFYKNMNAYEMKKKIDCLWQLSSVFYTLSQFLAVCENFAFTTVLVIGI